MARTPDKKTYMMLALVERLKEMAGLRKGNTGIQRYIRAGRGNRRVMINE